jgi:hypothetical protein
LDDGDEAGLEFGVLKGLRSDGQKPRLVTRTVSTEVVELIDIFQQDVLVKREKPTSSGQVILSLHVVPIHEAIIITWKELDKKAPESMGDHLSQCSIPSPKSHSQRTIR